MVVPRHTKAASTAVARLSEVMALWIRPQRRWTGSGGENAPSAKRVNWSWQKKYVAPSAPVKALRRGLAAVPIGRPAQSRASGRG